MAIDRLPEALGPLYSQHRSAWLRLARRHARQDAEDAVHDAMVVLLEQDNPLPGDSKEIEALILRIASTIQQRERRRGIIRASNGTRAHRRGRLIDPEGDPWKAYPSVEMPQYEDPSYLLKIAVRRALEHVDFDLVLRACVNGETAKQIAAERGCTPRTVFYAIGRALKALTRHLAEYRGSRRYRLTQRARIYGPKAPMGAPKEGR